MGEGKILRDTLAPSEFRIFLLKNIMFETLMLFWSIDFGRGGFFSVAVLVAYHF